MQNNMKNINTLKRWVVCFALLLGAGSVAYAQGDMGCTTTNVSNGCTVSGDPEADVTCPEPTCGNGETCCTMLTNAIATTCTATDGSTCTAYYPPCSNFSCLASATITIEPFYLTVKPASSVENQGLFCLEECGSLFNALQPTQAYEDNVGQKSGQEKAKMQGLTTAMELLNFQCMASATIMIEPFYLRVKPTSPVESQGLFCLEECGSLFNALQATQAYEDDISQKSEEEKAKMQGLPLPWSYVASKSSELININCMHKGSYSSME